jgi:hypothetical protein
MRGGRPGRPARIPHMDIEIVMRKLYESEINCALSCFWDNGWDVKLGDEMNG